MPKPLGKKHRKLDVSQQLLQALALEKEKRTEEAERLYLTILEIDRNNCYATNRLAAICSTRGDHEEGLRLIEISLKSNPTSPSASVDHSQILQRLGRFEESLAAADRALILSPNDFNALYLRGVALDKLGRHREAMVSLKRAIAANAKHAAAHNVLGTWLADVGHYGEALDQFALAQSIDPEHAEAHFSEALVRLVRGEFELGWDKYEWRWRTNQPGQTITPFPQAHWDGRETLAGKRLYVYAEQGLGDCVMFARYLPLLARQASAVVFGVYPALTFLLSTLDDVTVVTEGDRIPSFDLQSPLLSLPRLMGTRLDTIPANVPYLRAPPVRLEKWRARLPRDRSPRVGLVWAGARSYAGDAKRSIGLGALAPILDESWCSFVSLHREVRPGDAAELAKHSEIVHFGEQLEDFADTAAIIAQLDLVISVDTSVAHIAGALGKPVWILLPFAPDFRWLLERTDSPWYPSATLFRQPKPGDWNSVVARVADKLASFGERAVG